MEKKSAGTKPYIGLVYTSRILTLVAESTGESSVISNDGTAFSG